MELIEENAAVLQSLGYNASAPVTARLVEFNIVLPNEASRVAAAPMLAELGFACKLSVDPIDPARPEMTARKKMDITAEAITEAEVALGDRLADVGAVVDGWGFWGETEH